MAFILLYSVVESTSNYYYILASQIQLVEIDDERSYLKYTEDTSKNIDLVD